MIDKPIPYGHQHITEEDIQAVVETLQSDYLTQGPKITEFEQVFARYVGAQYAVSVNNATAGLHLAASALGVKSGDKVVVTPMTFAASANCIRYCGGEVVFCDIDPQTYLMEGTFQGIVPVDFAGYPHQMKSSGNWLMNMVCGFLRMPVMPRADILWTVKAKSNVVETESLPICLFFLFIQ